MARKRRWTENQLRHAVESSTSIRSALKKLGLRATGGNYEQLKKYVQELKVSTSHFKGRGWSKGLRGINRPQIPLPDILIKGSLYQSHKLKNRLFREGLKKPACEECGWSKMSPDGRVPIELDHINGDRHDNRIENLRILCPNCHSLKPTHRGRNSMKKQARVVERYTHDT